MWILLLCVLIASAYWALSLNYKYWKKRGVPSPPVSFFGNLGSTLTFKKSIMQVYNDIYADYPDLLYVGFYKIRKPGIILRDPYLIKDVLVKEFSSFHDNDFELDENVDPIGGKNPFSLKGQKWKIVKSQLTPAFTTKKMKSMCPFMEDSANKMIKFIESQPDSSNENGMDATDICARFATEVVASCAFGLEGKSFDEADPEFRRMGKKIFTPTTRTTISSFLIFILPALAKFLKIKFFTDEVVYYFKQIVQATLKYREKNKVVRNDFLDYMMEIKSKPGDYVFTDDDVLAHALGFFVDGFETSSAVMSHTLFQLGANPDIQDNLLDEIQAIFQKNNGKFNYDSINEMQYLDAVICETLRLHPPGMALIRVCTKPFTLPSPRGAGVGPDVQIEADTPVIVPVYGLHHDSKYYDDSHRFDPNRFLGNNKESLTKYTYLPFGEGPRNCLGWMRQRFGILQTKVAVANLVANFELKINNRTITPLEIDPTSLIPHPKGGIWLNFYKRSR